MNPFEDYSRDETSKGAVLADDLSRIVSLYGRPDEDVQSDTKPVQQDGRTRYLTYSSVKVLFTFVPESERTVAGQVRWRLLLVNDTASHRCLSPWAAAQRFYGRQS